MSHHAYEWARAQTIGNPHGKALLLYLATCHNGETGQCNPAEKRILADLELSKSTLIRMRALLRQLGLIEHERDGIGHAYSYSFPALSGAPDAPGGVTETPVPAESGVRETPVVVSERHQVVSERHHSGVRETPKRERTGKNGKGNGKGARARASPKGTPMTDSWLPSKDGFDFARKEGLSDEALSNSIERFRNHYLGEHRANWEGKWRNWAQTDARKHNREGRGHGGRRPQREVKRDFAQALRDRVDRGANGGPAGSARLPAPKRPET